jgi:hypothetical protein
MWLPSKGHHKVLEINNIKVVQSETAKKPKGDGDLCQECLCYIAQLRQKQQRSRKATGIWTAYTPLQVNTKSETAKKPKGDGDGAKND